MKLSNIEKMGLLFLISNSVDNLRLIDDCLVVLWLVDPAFSDDDVDDDDEDEEVLVLAIAPEAAVEGFSLSLFGELALELSDEDEDGPLSEAVEGLLHGLLFSLEAVPEAVS